MIIRDALPQDSKAIADIYNHYIAHTTVTFEEAELSSREISERLNDTKVENLPWFVAQNSQGDVLGYAYASKWKGRCAYRFSVEVTIYLRPGTGGKGLGTQLYEHLFAALKAAGIYVVIGGITLPNEASIALHEKFGMEKTGHFKEVGFKFGEWVDVGYWQGFL